MNRFGHLTGTTFNGGARKGAGRPKGSVDKPKLRDHLSEEEVSKLVQLAKKKADEGDTNILRFLLEQIFGRAPQSIEANVTGSFSLTELLDGQRHSNNARVSAESTDLHQSDVESNTPTVEGGLPSGSSELHQEGDVVESPEEAL